MPKVTQPSVVGGVMMGLDGSRGTAGVRAPVDGFIFSAKGEEKQQKGQGIQHLFRDC